MATQSEIEQVINDRVKAMDDIIIADSIKQNVAGLALLMECCYAAAKDLEGRLEHTKNVPRGVAGVEGKQERKDIALALFNAMTAQSLALRQTQQTISLGDLQLPGRN